MAKRSRRDDGNRAKAPRGGAPTTRRGSAATRRRAAAGGGGRTERPRRAKSLTLDEALIALFIGAMASNRHEAPDELARTHHLIWSAKRFRRKSGEAVGRLIDRMKRLIEDDGPAVVLERAAPAIPAALRPSAFAVTADLLLADGKIDARERRFLDEVAARLKLTPRLEKSLIDAMLVKNRI